MGRVREAISNLAYRASSVALSAYMMSEVWKYSALGAYSNSPDYANLLHLSAADTSGSVTVAVSSVLAVVVVRGRVVPFVRKRLGRQQDEF